jgi:hypothetical protein
MWNVHENSRKEILLQEMHAVTLLKISLIVSDVFRYRPIRHIICIKHDKINKDFKAINDFYIFTFPT